MRDWLRDWPPLAWACGLPLGKDGCPRIPCPSQQCKRGQSAGTPLPEALFILSVLTAIRCRLIGARDLIIDSVPILAWRRADPDAAYGHAPAQHPRPLLRGYRVHTLICHGSGLPIFFLLSPANSHDALFAQHLLAWAICLYQILPRVIRLDAAYCGLRLIAWIHTVLGAVAVIPWNPKRQKTAPVCLPPGPERNWANAVVLNTSLAGLSLLSPPTSSSLWQVVLTYTATIIVALAARQAGRPDLIRSPKRVLAHTWEGF